MTSLSEVQSLQADLLRQKIVFDSELRNQREHFQAQIDDAHEQLQAREIDCRNLQAVVTILGRKLDSVSIILEQQQLQQEALKTQQRYPSRQRSGSVSSQQPPVPAPDAFSAFGRHSTFKPKVAPPAPLPQPTEPQLNVIGQTPRRAGSPLRAGYALIQQFSRTQSTSSSVPSGQPPSINVYGSSSNATTLMAPQHAYQLPRQTVPALGAEVATSAPPTVQSEPTATMAASTLAHHVEGPRGGATTPNRTTRRPIVAPTELGKGQALNVINSTTPISGSRPASPRTLASMNAFRPIPSVLGSGAVGFRGPLPTRITPERLRTSH
eukprot:GILI01022925.1.p1 GENE.GILI01022925.1~~GILI01022925.1.p1  ORF type:complete len:324 (+),score=41.87 GILI01022925.1:47-1018(+)